MTKAQKNTIIFLYASLILFLLFMVVIKVAVSSPDANVPTSSSIGIFSENGELKAYRESHSWGVKTTATVLKSSCRVCLDNNYIDDCWNMGECLTVNKN